MSTIADAIRPFWLAGINNVAGRTPKEIGGWICDENYQIYTPVFSNKFTLQVFDLGPLLNSFAAEISRVAIAAFETLNQESERESEKAIAWVLIKTYYAAFFAAHALMRMMGLGCGPIGKSQVNSVLRVANSWSVAVPQSITGGLYQFHCDIPASEFKTTLLSGSPHEGFWKLFDSQIKAISEAVLDPKSAVTLDIISRQAVALKLDDLRRNLSRVNGNATWLTQIRNAVNYDHRFSAWYPYAERKRYYTGLNDKRDSWKDAAMDIELSNYTEEELSRFQATCNFIVAMCRESIEDMSTRCSDGKSFHEFGALAYLNHLKIPSKKGRPR
jgi:hypothetical protein